MNKTKNQPRSATTPAKAPTAPIRKLRELPEFIGKLKLDKSKPDMDLLKRKPLERPILSGQDFVDKSLEIANSGAPAAQMRAQFQALHQELKNDITREVQAQFTTAAALPTLSQETGPKLPEPGSFTLYRDRPLAPGMKRRRITAKEHFEAVWKPFADAGVLYMDDLRKLDKELVTALYNQAKREKNMSHATPWEVHDILPTRSARTSLRLAAEGDEGIKKAKQLASSAFRRRAKTLPMTEGHAPAL